MGKCLSNWIRDSKWIGISTIVHCKQNNKIVGSVRFF